MGERNIRFLWDLGRLAGDTNPKVAAAALQELLRLQPDRVDVRTELAWVQLQSDGPSLALLTLAPVKKVPPAQAVRFFEVFALSKYKAGDPDEASKSAARMTEVAREEPDQIRAQRLTALLQANAANAARPLPRHIGESNEAAVLAERPTIRRTGAASPPLEEEPVVQKPDPELRGTLVGLNCASSPPRLTVEAESRVYAFLLDRAGQIAVLGSATGSIDLNCGPQRPHSIRVEYSPLATPVAGVDVSLKLIEFLADR